MIPTDDPALLHAIATGGPVLFAAFAASIVVFGIAMAKVWEILAFRVQLGRVERGVLVPARTGDLGAARKGCEELRGGMQALFAGGLDRALGVPALDPAPLMRREERRVMATLRARVWLLGSTGALMPFLGLLGTVVGVLVAFRSIGESGESGFSVVASGISEALIATAAGLFVALEAVALYNMLQNLIGAQARELSLLIDEVVELARLHGGPDDTPAS